MPLSGVTPTIWPLNPLQSRMAWSSDRDRPSLHILDTTTTAPVRLMIVLRRETWLVDGVGRPLRCSSLKPSLGPRGLADQKLTMVQYAVEVEEEYLGMFCDLQPVHLLPQNTLRVLGVEFLHCLDYLVWIGNHGSTLYFAQ